MRELWQGDLIVGSVAYSSVDMGFLEGLCHKYVAFSGTSDFHYWGRIVVVGLSTKMVKLFSCLICAVRYSLRVKQWTISLDIEQLTGIGPGWTNLLFGIGRMLFWVVVYVEVCLSIQISQLTYVEISCVWHNENGERNQHNSDNVLHFKTVYSNMTIWTSEEDVQHAETEGQ